MSDEASLLKQEKACHSVDSTPVISNRGGSSKQEVPPLELERSALSSSSGHPPKVLSAGTADRTESVTNSTTSVPKTNDGLADRPGLAMRMLPTTTRPDDWLPLPQLFEWGFGFTKRFFQTSLQPLLKSCSQTAILSGLPGPAPAFHKKTEQGDGQVHGLRNDDQACFLNSVLQALASSEPFLAYLQRVVELGREQEENKREGAEGVKLYGSFLGTSSIATTNEEEDAREKHAGEPSLGLDLLETLRKINGHSRSYGIIDARNILLDVGKQNVQFRRGGTEQQDAQEFLQALVECLVSEAGLDSLLPSIQRSAAAAFSEGEVQEDPDDDITIMSCIERRKIGTSTRLSDQETENGGLSMSPETKQSLENGTTDTAIVVDGTESPAKACLQAETSGASSDDCSWPEEKKEFEFEPYVHQVSSELNMRAHVSVPNGRSIGGCVDTMSDVSEDLSQSWSLSKDLGVSVARQIMMTTLSLLSPSPLTGWYGSTLQCAQCRHIRPVVNQPFLNIPVVPTAVSDRTVNQHPGDPPVKVNSMFQSSRPCTVEECLRNYTRIERVHDVDCSNCALRAEIERLEEDRDMLQKGVSGHENWGALYDDLQRAEKRLFELYQISPDDEISEMLSNDDGDVEVERKRGDAFKCLYLTRLPAVLCLHVQRRFYDPFTNSTTKTAQQVIFQEHLDVSPFCAYSEVGCSKSVWAGTQPQHSSGTKAPPILYRLVALIEHRGTAFGGHYVCYRRHSETGQWIYASDEATESRTWKDVQSRQAYMLFYEAM